MLALGRESTPNQERGACTHILSGDPGTAPIPSTTANMGERQVKNSIQRPQSGLNEGRRIRIVFAGRWRAP